MGYVSWLPVIMLTKKVCQMHETFEKVKKKYWFRKRGAHIDVTTLERKACFFWKVEDLRCVLQGFARAHQSVWPVFLEVFWEKKVCPKRYTHEKVKKKWWFRMGGVHIDVTTLERNEYFFWKVIDVLSVFNGFATPKSGRKSVPNRSYTWKFVKQVAISCVRCEHQCHHVATRDLL